MPATKSLFQRLLVTLVVHLVIASWAFVMPGCNTTEGAGKDLQRAGDEIKKEAHDVGTPDSRDYD